LLALITWTTKAILQYGIIVSFEKDTVFNHAVEFYQMLVFKTIFENYFANNSTHARKNIVTHFVIFYKRSQ
jgi:hypothetical protein